MKRLSLFLSLILTLTFLLSACGKGEANAPARVGFLKGPTGIGASYLMEQNQQGKTKYSYDFTVAGAADELTGRLVSGDLDMAALPTNVIATLYQKSKGQVKVLGINTLGVLYLLEKGDTIHQLSDLKGKTILASGQGTTAEYLLQHLLQENGISANIEWTTEHTETVTRALMDNYDVVMLPEPFVTTLMTKGSGYRVALDLTKDAAMGGIAVRTEYYESHPKEVAAFLKEYGESVAFVNQNVKQAARLCETYGIIPAVVAEQAIPRCNIVWQWENYEDTLLSFLKVLYHTDPQSVGGALPDQAFFAAKA